MSQSLKYGVILLVTAVLVLAAALVCYRPGRKSKYRFVRLSAGNLLIHLMDGLITFVNTPDLAREGNPLVAKFGFGWEALFLANLIGFLLITLMAWNFCRYEHERIPARNMFDYYMKLLYGENYKVSWFWYKFAKNRRAMFALVSYACYWGLTAGAPVYVVGWMLSMLDMTPGWWHDNVIIICIEIAVIPACIYLWTRDGFLKSGGHMTDWCTRS